MIAKFRVWNKMNRRMYSVIDSIGLSNEQPSTVRIWADDILMTFLIGEEVELMQSTGLKDKNDIEIFEGDIVEIEINDGFDYGSFIGAIDYLEGSWMINNRINYARALWSETDKVEILGSIYENPDLLKVR